MADHGDFRARATASFNSHLAAASFSAPNPAEAIAKELANDRSTIDSAVKSYMSLVAARSLTLSPTDATGVIVAGTLSDKGMRRCSFRNSKDSRMDALKCARVLLRSVNSLTLSDSQGLDANSVTKNGSKSESTELERSVVRIVWNGLIKSEKKPSKFLGRKSLRIAYPQIISKFRNDADRMLPEGVDREDALSFFEEFGLLLQSSADDKIGDNDDDDSALLWNLDGGASELNKRREKRAKKGKDAAAAAAQTKVVSSLTIEEISESDEADAGHDGDGKMK